MTADARPSPLTRVLDILFGKSLTHEQRRRFEASRPPKAIERAYGVLYLASFLAVLTVFLWGYGWLPFVDSRLDKGWFWPVFGVNVLLRLGWEQVTGFYERRARAGEALKAASPE
jgi:hypothetical protein